MIQALKSDDIVNKVGGRFKLTALIQKRMLELMDGARPLVERGDLTDRGRDSAEDINKRFRAAKREIHMAKGSRAFDTMVVNDSLDRAVEEISKIIKHKRSGGI